jgi:hypothetical protein
MSKLPRILSLVVLLYLFGAGSSFADTLQVTFTATIDLFPASETVSGSFLWNTQTEALSNVSLTSGGPYSFLSVVIEADFAPANFVNNYPQGSLIFLDFQDASHTINFQINYGDHAYLDPPLFPGPGVHHNVPFDIGGAGIGDTPGRGDVTVTGVAEPASAILLASGLAALVARRKLRKTAQR